MKNKKSVLDKINQLSPVAFACILCLFFMPFLEFKCNGEKYFSVTGMDMVYGGEIEWVKQDSNKTNTKDSLVKKIEANKSMFDQNVKSKQLKTKKIHGFISEDNQKVRPQLLIILAFLCAGVGVFLIKNELKTAKIKIVIALLGLVFLVTFRITMLADYDINYGSVSSDRMRLVHFLFAFGLCNFLFLAIAIVQWMKNRKDKVEKEIAEMEEDF